MATETNSTSLSSISSLSSPQDTPEQQSEIFSSITTTASIPPHRSGTSTYRATSRESILPLQHEPPTNPFVTPARCTLHNFPDLQPISFATYPSTHLLLPLRKDILHRAVIYEADGSRSGTASTKHRSQVHGSGRKIAPQKGTGNARVGDKKSPIRRGGGVAHGPHPRDFSTDLPPKLYDLAWRTALSYRYRRGQLIVLDGQVSCEHVSKHARARYLAEMLQWHKLGHKQGRTMIITSGERPDMEEAFQDELLQWEGDLLRFSDIDVKDLLKLGHIMIEKAALNRILRDHQSDLGPERRLGKLFGITEESYPQLQITTSVRHT